MVAFSSASLGPLASAHGACLSLSGGSGSVPRKGVGDLTPRNQTKALKVASREARLTEAGVGGPGFPGWWGTVAWWQALAPPGTRDGTHQRGEWLFVLHSVVSTL